MMNQLAKDFLGAWKLSSDIVDGYASINLDMSSMSLLSSITVHASFCTSALSLGISYF